MAKKSCDCDSKGMTLQQWAAAGGDVPKSFKGREKSWANQVKKFAAGGEVFNTVPDMSDGGQIIDGPAFAGGGIAKLAKMLKGTQEALPAAQREANLQKMLAESKAPMRLYHGTMATEGGKGQEAIRRIKPSKEGALGSGVYLTPQSEFASTYAGFPARSQLERDIETGSDFAKKSARQLIDRMDRGVVEPHEVGGNMLPVYAQIKNPLILDGSMGRDPMVEALVKLGMDKDAAGRMVENAYERKGYIGKEVESRARAAGYDGLMQYRDGNLTEVVSYNPNAVKSATGNVGTYDVTNPDLSKAGGGLIKGAIKAIKGAQKTEDVAKTSLGEVSSMVAKMGEEGRSPIIPVPNRWFLQPDKFPHQQKLIERVLATTGKAREDFPSGAFIDPRTGEVLDSRIMNELGVVIDPKTNRPMMTAKGEAGIERIDPKLGAYTKSNLVRKGLFKPEGGDPLLNDLNFLATIEKGDVGHKYGLATEYASPAELFNTGTGANPTLRPRSRGDLFGVGDVVGQVRVGRSEPHDVYEKLFVAPKGSDVQGVKLSKSKGGAVEMAGGGLMKAIKAAKGAAKPSAGPAFGSWGFPDDLLRRERGSFASAFGVDYGQALTPSFEFVPVKRLNTTEKVDEAKVRSLMQAMKESGNTLDNRIPPVIVDSAGNVLDGHHRVEAARRLGYDQVPVIEKFDRQSGPKFGDEYAEGGAVHMQDGGAAFGVFPHMKRKRTKQDPEAAKNVPVDLARGFVAGALGMPGDIESLARLPYELITGNESPTILPTSGDIEKRLPFKSDTPVSRLATEAGQFGGGFYTGPGSGARAAMAVPRAIKRAGQDFVMAAPQGAPRMFIGPKAKTWDQAKADAAVRMEQEGRDPVDIWRETGTFRSADGILRQEISDVGAVHRNPTQLKELGKQKKEEAAELQQRLTGIPGQKDMFPKALTEAKRPVREKVKTLKEEVDELMRYSDVRGQRAKFVLEHPELYKAYPELAEILVYQGNRGFGSERASLRGGPQDMRMEITQSGLRDDPRSSALHEMQHAIQTIEEMGPGGSPTFAFNDPKAYEILEELRKKALEPMSFDDYAKQYSHVPDLQRGYESYKGSIPRIVKNMDRELQSQAAMEYYKRLSGEAEARATQAREPMSASQRAQEFPYSSYDVLPEDLIVKAPKSSSVSMQMGPDDYRPVKAGETIGDLTIGENISNRGSIEASGIEKVLPGVRAVPMSSFEVTAPHDLFYAKDDLDRVRALAEEIKQSGRIDPMIVGVDEKGNYILEGAHRLGALHLLGAKEFPALIAVEEGVKGFSSGGEVKMQDGGAAFGRYTTGKKYQGAVKRAKEADVNTLADPRTYAFVSGLLGEAPDQLGFSAMHPDYQGIQKAGEKGFTGGTILGVAPLMGPLTKNLPVGASIKSIKGPQEEALMLARQRAEKLGQSANPKTRMLQQGYEPDWYHGSTGDITRFRPDLLGETTGAQSAKKGFFFARDPQNPPEAMLKKSSDPASIEMLKKLGIPDDEIAKLNTVSMKGHGAETASGYASIGGSREYKEAMRKAKSAEKRGDWSEYEKQTQIAEDAEIGKSQYLQGLVAKYGDARDEMLDAIQNAVYSKKLPQDQAELLDQKVKQLMPYGWYNSYSNPQIEGLKKEIVNLIGEDAAKKSLDKINKFQSVKNERALMERTQEGGNVMPVALRYEKPMVYDFEGSPYRDQSYSDLVDQAIAGGHDALILKNTYDPGGGPAKLVDVGVVFDPDQVRSKFAAFDPLRKTAATAAASGLAAPDLLAEEQKKAAGGEVKMQAGGAASVVKNLLGIGQKGKGAAKSLTQAEKNALRSQGLGVPGEDFADVMNPADVMRMSEALGNAGAEGKTLNLTQADRSRVFGPNKGGTGFSGLQLTSVPHQQAGTTWGVGKPSHVTRLINANTPDTLWTTFIGSPTQHMSNPVTVERMYEAHKKAKPSAALIEKMNKQINGAVNPKTGKPVFSEPIDISDPASLAKAQTFDQRKVLAQAMTMGGEKKGEKATQEAFRIVREETDPLLVESPTYAVGNRLWTIDKDAGIYRPDLNAAFPYQVVGTDLGLVYNPAPIELAAPEFFGKFANRLNKSGKPQPMGHKDLAATTPKQLVDYEYLTNLQKAGYAKGGKVGGLSQAKNQRKK